MKRSLLSLIATYNLVLLFFRNFLVSLFENDIFIGHNISITDIYKQECVHKKYNNFHLFDSFI